MSNFKRLSVLTTLAALAASASASYSVSPLPGDLVTNGGFENAVAGWTASVPAPVVTADSAQAFSGQSCLTFTGDQATISQPITTVASTSYVINFHLKSSGGSPNSFVFNLNGSPLYTITDDSTGAADYQLHTYAFTTPASGPTATSNTIEISATGGTSSFNLDDISIVILPVPCDSTFFAFDPSNGHLKVESGKVYPSPPETDTSFPVVDDNGNLLFSYKSDAISHTFPRAVVMGLAPTGTKFTDTVAACQFTKSQGLDCPATPDIGIAFSQGSTDPNVFSGSLESLFLSNCLTRTPSGDSFTYSGSAFTLYTDPYALGNQWSELKPFTISINVPYSSQAMASSPPINIVVSNEVSVSYLPVEVINDGSGSNPTVQFSTIATTFYPHVAYGEGTKYTPPSGSPTAATDPSGNGVCVLYKSSGVITSDSAYCDSNPGICTVECTRTIPVVAPVCDLSGYDWAFAFEEFEDFSLASTATTQSTDPTWASFTEDLVFDDSPQWTVCPSASSPDYLSFLTTSAIHGHFDTSSGDPVLESDDGVLPSVPLNFGFEISINLAASASNGVSPTSAHIYKATLTEVKVTGPHGDYYLVGSSAAPTVGGAGAGVPFVHGLTFTPAPTVPNIYQMTISPQTNPTDPKFAAIAVSFIPNLGDSSGSNILYNSDGGSPVTLTVTFAGVISLFADGSTPSKRDIVFRRQVRTSSNGTYADPSQVVNSLSKQDSTTVIIEMPNLGKAISAATIIGAIIGGLIGLALLAVGFFFFKRRSDSVKRSAVTSRKLEFGDY